MFKHTHSNGNPGFAGWGEVEVQASAEDVKVCNQGFHCWWFMLWGFLF